MRKNSTRYLGIALAVGLTGCGQSAEISAEAEVSVDHAEDSESPTEYYISGQYSPHKDANCSNDSVRISNTSLKIWRSKNLIASFSLNDVRLFEKESNDNIVVTAQAQSHNAADPFWWTFVFEKPRASLASYSEMEVYAFDSNTPLETEDTVREFLNSEPQVFGGTLIPCVTGR